MLQAQGSCPREAELEASDHSPLRYQSGPPHWSTRPGAGPGFCATETGVLSPVFPARTFSLSFAAGGRPGEPKELQAVSQTSSWHTCLGEGVLQNLCPEVIWGQGSGL